LLTALALTVLAGGVFPEDDGDRHVAVFTAPLVVPGALIMSGLFPNGPFGDVAPMAVVPLGVVFPVDGTEWVVDLAVMGSQPSGVVLGHFGYWLAAGPVVHSGREPLSGFFFNPKVSVGVFQSTTIRDVHEWAVNVTAGADLGYQLVWRRIYLAFVLGASIGVGLNETDSLAGPLINTHPTQSSNHDLQLVGGVNVQFFRIGDAF